MPSPKAPMSAIVTRSMAFSFNHPRSENRGPAVAPFVGFASVPFAVAMVRGQGKGRAEPRVGAALIKFLHGDVARDGLKIDMTHLAPGIFPNQGLYQQ